MTQPVISSVTISVEDPRSTECLALLADLTTELSWLYDDDGGADSFNPEDALTLGAVFLVARLTGSPIGCGAIRLLVPGTGEVKRMYVVPDARGRGVGRQILQELEALAIKFGYERLRLETGLKQPAAIGLYESFGYHRVECYGKYVGNSLSVCFEKMLAGKDQGYGW